MSSVPLFTSVGGGSVPLFTSVGGGYCMMGGGGGGGGEGGAIHMIAGVYIVSCTSTP